jgi:hypothetical protein
MLSLTSANNIDRVFGMEDMGNDDGRRGSSRLRQWRNVWSQWGDEAPERAGGQLRLVEGRAVYW